MPTLLQGPRITLGAIDEDDLPTVGRWFNDYTFMHTFNGRPFYPRPQWVHEKDIRAFIEEKDTYLFGVRIASTDEIIGITDLEIQWPNRHAALGIGIGDAAHRGLGYGEEAMRLLLTYGFTELNLHRIYLTVFSYNTAAIKLYERLGFAHEGTLREHLLRDGTAYDMHYYGLLASEWRQS